MNFHTTMADVEAAVEVVARAGRDVDEPAPAAVNGDGCCRV
ncbi:MAG TPA: hypothetical protein VFX12_10180 [Vicinamibacterales bacterium]|nr:hypothetical protein [Vicinamibacterales bacterium]